MEIISSKRYFNLMCTKRWQNVSLSLKAKVVSKPDKFNNDLDELKSFVLPGGSLLASWFHFARTVARRSERRITRLAAEEVINLNVLIYINRLSDLLFVMARSSNNNGQNDVLWQPGKSR